MLGKHSITELHPQFKLVQTSSNYTHHSRKIDTELQVSYESSFKIFTAFSHFPILLIL
jgi:hypothetical protein